MTDLHYVVKGSSIIYEIIDGEVIVANLDEGFYYSVDGPIGVAVWESLIAGISVVRIAEMLSKWFNSPRGEIEQGIAGFVEKLEQEGLLVAEKAKEGSSKRICPASLSQENLPSSFVPPDLVKYTDMQQLLLLDPIHEVDETGWPSAPSEQEQI